MANSSVVGLLKVVLAADTAAFNAAMAKSEDMAQEFARTGAKLATSLEASHQKIVYGAHAVVEAMSQMQGKMALTANEAKQWQAKITAAMDVQKAMGRPVDQDFLKASNALGAIATQGDKASGVMGLLKNQFVQMGAAFSGAMLLDRAVSGLVTLGREAISSGGRIKDMATQLGVSTDAVQQWSFAAEQAGATFDDIALAVTQMNNRLATGDDSTKAALNAIGLKFADIRAMKPEEAFNTIARAVAAVRDPMQQVQVAMDLFGKGGPKILAAMKDGFDENMAKAPLLSKATIDGLDEAEDAWRSFYQHLVVYSGQAIAGIVNNFKFTQLGAAKEGAGLWAALFGGIAAGKVGDTSQAPTVVGKALETSLTPALKGAAQALKEFDDANGTTAQNMAKAQAAIDKQAEAIKRAEEAYQKYARELLTGVTDAQRQELEWQKRLVAEGHGVELAILKGKTEAYNLLAQAIKKGVDARKLLGASPIPADFLSGIVSTQSIGDFLTMSNQGNLLNGRDPITLGPPPKALQDMTMFNALLDVGQLAMRNFGTTGSKAWRTVVAGVESSIGMVGKYVQAMKVAKAANDAAGKSAAASSLAMGAATMGISLVAGAIIGGIQDAMATAEATRKLIAGLKTDLVGLGYAIEDVNAAKAQLTPKWDSSLSLGANAVNQVSQTVLGKILETAKKTITAIGDLQSAVSDFGGSVPGSLRPLLDQLLQSSHLTAQMRAQLEGLAGPPAWQKIQERADALGVSMAALGQSFSQSKFGDIALGYVRDLQMFADAGANMTGVLEGMSDELSTLVQNAIKNGVALPKTLQPYLEQLAAMGKLLDENGNAIDAGALDFKDIQDETLKNIQKILESIRDLLAGLPTVAANAGKALQTSFFSEPRVPPVDAAADTRYPTWMPGFASGTMGRLLNFGSGTPVMLHGWEGVYTATDASRAGSGGGGTAILQIGSRVLAEVVVPEIPGVVKRYALNR
jgi:hypothetical protein